MFKDSCPGSQEIRQPYPEEIVCSGCGKTLEVWSDEPETECKNCGRVNKKVIGPACIDWCPHAKECVGAEKYDRLANREK